MPSLATFNANNFFLRYKFTRYYPGANPRSVQDELAEVASQGFLPAPSFGRFGLSRFIVWDPARRELAAQALAEPDGQLPDILCFQEVENIQAIRTFNQQYLDDHYQYSLLIDAYDPRNIDVGVLSVFPIVNVKSHIEEVHDGGQPLFENRDCLEVDIQLPGGEVLTLFVNHLKSKFVTREQNDTDASYKAKVRKSHAKRKAQAEQVLQYVKGRFGGRHNSALYAVVGDFNDTPESPYLAKLLSSNLLTDVIRRHCPSNACWTYYWRSKGRVSQIDYVLASKALTQRVNAVAAADPSKVPYIERGGLGFRELNAQNEVLPSKATLVHYETDDVTPPSPSATPNEKVDFRFPRYETVLGNWKNNISDHCPVKVWF